MKIKELNISIILLLFVLPSFQSCIEPVNAEYDLQAGIIFIDGYALTETGLSSITITESDLIFDNYRQGIFHLEIS